MNFYRLILMVAFVLTLAGCGDAVQVDGYQPDNDAPTHDKMFEELFGIPEDANTVPEIFSNAEPHPYLQAALSLLWFMAAASLLIITGTGMLKSVLNAPQSKSFLGSDISTPVAPIRIGIAFFLLMSIPDGKHYSMIESIILASNKFVSNQANNLFIDTSEIVRIDESDIKRVRESFLIMYNYIQKLH